MNENYNQLVDLNMDNAVLSLNLFDIMTHVVSEDFVRIDALALGIPCVASFVAGSVDDAKKGLIRSLSFTMLFGRANEFGDIMNSVAGFSSKFRDAMIGISNPWDLYRERLLVNGFYRSMSFDWASGCFCTILNGREVYGSKSIDVGSGLTFSRI